jgi:hypothetical protein
MVEISEEDLKKIEKMLNSTISNLMYGGSGDPGWNECSGAAVCFKILKILRLQVKNEEEISEQLSVPENNISGRNFLKD